MGVFARGDIVLVKFPYSDLSQVKLRPAVVLTQGEFNDVMLCQITSKKHSDKIAVEITSCDFESGSLRSRATLALSESPWSVRVSSSGSWQH